VVNSIMGPRQKWTGMKKLALVARVSHLSTESFFGAACLSKSLFLVSNFKNRRVLTTG
jgi:hypothetical protein